MEERNRILGNASKLVPGPKAAPLTDPILVMVAFPAMPHEWDCNTAEGKESLRVYCQALLAGLKATSR